MIIPKLHEKVYKVPAKIMELGYKLKCDWQDTLMLQREVYINWNKLLGTESINITAKC